MTVMRQPQFKEQRHVIDFSEIRYSDQEPGNPVLFRSKPVNLM